jgi:hypothetical protein
MNRHHNIFKTSSGLSTRKALLNHIILSPSQTGETVPLMYPLCTRILRGNRCMGGGEHPAQRGVPAGPAGHLERYHLILKNILVKEYFPLFTWYTYRIVVKTRIIIVSLLVDQFDLFNDVIMLMFCTVNDTTA